MSLFAVTRNEHHLFKGGILKGTSFRTEHFYRDDEGPAELGSCCVVHSSMHSNMGSNVFKLKILLKIHFIALHNKRNEIKKYNH